MSDHTKGRVKAVTLLVPLLSAAWGHLIPPEARKLIPAKALEKMIVEIQLNPNAFFTSGYKHDEDHDGDDPIDSTDLIRRDWMITDISLEMDLWFYDQRVTQ